MNVYEELGLQTIINASDTYTRIGGSRMRPTTLEAMRQAAGCVVLLAAACMAQGASILERELPDASRCPRNEIVVFAAQKDCPVPPYWHLVELSGARL